MGYHWAGFDEIVGVDIVPQPRYPFTFIQADAMTFPLDGFDAIHASPPCQGYSIIRNLPWLRDKYYALLFNPIMERLQQHGARGVIDYVMGAKLAAGFLCGTMFNLPFYRHRAFETNWFWMHPPHAKHQQAIKPSRYLGDRARVPIFSGAEDSRGKESWPGRRGAAGHGLSIKKGGNVSAAFGIGHHAGTALFREAMAIPWMRRDELTQAIPPVYTEWIGQRLLETL